MTKIRKHSGRVLSYVRPDTGVREHYLLIGGAWLYAGSSDLVNGMWGKSGESMYWDKSGFYRRSVSLFVNDGIPCSEHSIRKWSGIKGNLLSKTYIKHWTSLQSLIDVGF